MLSISRKYATKAILPEQMGDFILDAAISIKNNDEPTEDVLKSLTENIKNSVKNNMVVLPVSGIVLETPFKIGIFNLYPQKTFIETTVLDLDAQRYGRGSFREILTNEMNFNQIILGNSDLWNRVNIAFEWLGKQYDEENDENKMIYSIFALECLLNSNTENFSSITAAVAEKCAYLLGTNKEERVSIFNDAKSFYRIRSALVHSSNKEGVNKELVDKSYGMAIGVLFKVVDLILNNHLDSLKKIDDYIMDLKFKD